MTDDAKSKTIERQQVEIDKLAEKIDAQGKSMHDLAVNVGQQTTVVQRFVTQQESHNRHINAAIDKMNDRIGSLEQHRAVLEATLPRRLVPAETIEARFEIVEAKADKINLTLAKWAGIAIAAMTGANLILPPMFRAIATWLNFGGAS